MSGEETPQAPWPGITFARSLIVSAARRFSRDAWRIIVDGLFRARHFYTGRIECETIVWWVCTISQISTKMYGRGVKCGWAEGGWLRRGENWVEIS